MCDARKERMIRETLGGQTPDVGFPEDTLRNIGVVALIVLVAVAVSPVDRREPVTGSSIDARAATRVHDAPPAKLVLDPNATDGNVVDMTY